MPWRGARRSALLELGELWPKLCEAFAVRGDALPDLRDHRGGSALDKLRIRKLRVLFGNFALEPRDLLRESCGLHGRIDLHLQLKAMRSDDGHRRIRRREVLDGVKPGL